MNALNVVLLMIASGIMGALIAVGVLYYQLASGKRTIRRFDGTVLDINEVAVSPSAFSRTSAEVLKSPPTVPVLNREDASHGVQ